MAGLSTEQVILKESLYQYIPKEYVSSIQYYALPDFLLKLANEHHLYFPSNGYRIFQQLAWWKNPQPVYHTSLNHYLGFEQLYIDPPIQSALKQHFSGSLFITFVSQRANFEDNLLLIEISQEVFFELGVIYIQELYKDFDQESHLIFSQDFSKWMIPSSYQLSELITNFTFAPDSFPFEKVPWQSHFLDLKLPQLTIEANIFDDLLSSYQHLPYLENALCTIQDYLYEYYRSDDTLPYTPQELFSLLTNIANNLDYDHLIFFESYQKEHFSLAKFIRKIVLQWHVMYEDAFSDSSDPDNRFSRDAEDCLYQIRKVTS